MLSRVWWQPYLCTTLTSQNMVDAFKEVRLDLYNSGVSVNVFDNNSDGDVAYKLYQVSVDADASSSSSVAMTYEEVQGLSSFDGCCRLIGCLSSQQ